MSAIQTAETPLVGPLERATLPKQLRARVVTPGARPEVHGYDVEGDLARHYGFVDLLVLSLTGELASSEARRAVEVALMFLAPASVAHASVHSAVLARLCGAPASAVIGVSALGLAEQARFELSASEPLLTWLKRAEGPLPDAFRAKSEDERAMLARLTAALSTPGIELPILQFDPTPQAAILALLYAAGLRRREQLEAALVLARLPSTIAEGLAERPTNFAKYPIDLPRFVYRDPK